MIKLKLFFLLLLIYSCSSCGYRWGHGGIADRYSSITVPYVDGDWNGELTAAIIKELSDAGTLRYCPNGGELLLKVSILDFREDEIGFRYERKSDDCFKKSIIPDENRLYIYLEVEVVEAISCTSLIGPVRFSAYVEYDHDYYAVRDSVNVFSLGQLTDIDGARDAVQKPLNRQAAKKIVSFVLDNW